MSPIILYKMKYVALAGRINARRVTRDSIKLAATTDRTLVHPLRYFSVTGSRPISDQTATARFL